MSNKLRLSASLPEPQKCEETHRPNLSIMPIDNGMHPHESRPSGIRNIEVRQALSMGIRPPGPNSYCFDFLMLL